MRLYLDIRKSEGNTPKPPAPPKPMTPSSRTPNPTTANPANASASDGTPGAPPTGGGGPPKRYVSRSSVKNPPAGTVGTTANSYIVDPSKAAMETKATPKPSSMGRNRGWATPVKPSSSSGPSPTTKEIVEAGEGFLDKDTGPTADVAPEEPEENNQVPQPDEGWSAKQVQSKDTPAPSLKEVVDASSQAHRNKEMAERDPMGSGGIRDLDSLTEMDEEDAARAAELDKQDAAKQKQAESNARRAEEKAAEEALAAEEAAEDEANKFRPHKNRNYKQIAHSGRAFGARLGQMSTHVDHGGGAIQMASEYGTGGVGALGNKLLNRTPEQEAARKEKWAEKEAERLKEREAKKLNAKIDAEMDAEDAAAEAEYKKQRDAIKDNADFDKWEAAQDAYERPDDPRQAQENVRRLLDPNKDKEVPQNKGKIRGIVDRLTGKNKGSNTAQKSMRLYIDLTKAVTIPNVSMDSTKPAETQRKEYDSSFERPATGVSGGIPTTSKKKAQSEEGGEEDEEAPKTRRAEDIRKSISEPMDMFARSILPRYTEAETEFLVDVMGYSQRDVALGNAVIKGHNRERFNRFLGERMNKSLGSLRFE